MSQIVPIVGFRVTNAPYTGIDADGAHRFARTGLEAAQWLASASRTRFNQARSARSKYVYVDDVRQLNEDGSPQLVPIGSGAVLDLTHGQARQQFSYLSAVPSLILKYQGRDERKSWDAAIKRRSTNVKRGRTPGAMPRFKSRHHADETFGMFANHRVGAPAITFQRTGKRSAVVSFRGQNPAGITVGGVNRHWVMTVRVRVPKKMIVHTFTSILVNVTTNELMFTSPPQRAAHTPTGKTVGIDAGLTVHFASNDGHLVNTTDTSELVAVRKRAQKSMARKRETATKEHRNFWESKRYQAAKQVAATAQTTINNVREDFRHKLTNSWVKDFDYIAVEDLNLVGLTKSAAGTVVSPGANVAQKRGLNRGFADAATGTVYAMLAYKAKASGVAFVQVNPAYTSQRCTKCGHISAENRETQAVFSCIACGHTANADVNAAQNILERANKTWGGARPKQARECQTTKSGSHRVAIPV